MAFELNEHHKTLILNYMRFAKFQRKQCLKSINSCFGDAKDTKFQEATYTVDEIIEALDDLASEVQTEVESELINSSHMNVLLLQQVFKEAQQWHLELNADLAELENRELLDLVKNWEDSELSHQPIEKPSLSPSKRKLAPLGNASGPLQLLKHQLEEANEEREMLKSRLRDLETKATSVLNKRDEDTVKLQENDKKWQLQQEEASNEMSQTIGLLKSKMATEAEISSKSQEELEVNLGRAKNELLKVQSQLHLAEKELEKKFSETGAYKNFKKMLNSKNDQIRELRQQLNDLKAT